MFLKWDEKTMYEVKPLCLWNIVIMLSFHATNATHATNNGIHSDQEYQTSSLYLSHCSF